jgi:hypothetical protein
VYRPPGIDDAGTIAVVARRDADDAVVVLAGPRTGLTEIVSGWNGKSFWDVQSFLMVRDPAAGPVFSFVGRTGTDGRHPDADGVYRLHRFANGQLELIADSTAFGNAIHEGVVNEAGDYALVYPSSGLSLAYGRYGGAPTTILGGYGSYPLAPVNQVAGVTDIRMNALGQVAFNAVVWDPVAAIPLARQLRYDPPGSTQCSPLLPEPCAAPDPRRYCFGRIRRCNFSIRGVRGCWLDPPVAQGYVYTMAGGAHFTAITGFPTGFAAPFRVIADGVDLGTFGPGDQVEFAPPGVTTFTVRDIQPGPDPARTDAFPLRVATDRDEVDFDMTVLVDRVDVGVAATALTLVDQTPAGRTAKLKFGARDAAITKGAGTSLTSIGATLTVAYEGGGVSGRWTIPAGDGGWTLNDATRASYTNRLAPGGATQVKTLRLLSGKTAKLTAAGRGDTPIDIVTPGAPPARVLTALCVQNAGEQVCQCSAFSGCAYRALSSGAKLTCKQGVADAACAALP